MAVEIFISDPASDNVAKIGDAGGLAVIAPRQSMTFNATLSVDDTPVQVVAPKGSNKFHITGILLTGTKSINANIDATVEIYTALSGDTSTAVTTLITIPVAQSSSRDILLGTNYITAESGHVIMAKTDDETVNVTILGYYIEG